MNKYVVLKRVCVFALVYLVLYINNVQMVLVLLLLTKTDHVIHISYIMCICFTLANILRRCAKNISTIFY